MNRPIIFLAVFLALGISAQTNALPSDQAATRAKQLKDGIETFRLELLYNGDEGKPFYRLTVSVPPADHIRDNPFYQFAQITETEASKIVDHLSQDGFLDSAGDVRYKKIGPPTMPGYTMKVTASEFVLYADLGWDLPMLKRLDSLKKVLEGDAAKGMDLLLGRLSPLRKQWESETAGDWNKLYEDQAWYKNHKQPEKVFRGTLQRHQEPEVSILMRPHRYKLGDRFIYPGKEHPELEKLVGQQVEVRGKPYDVELEGQSVREIWPAAIRTAGSATPKTATLAEALEDWIVLMEANDLETAQKQWAKDPAATKTMKEWWANLRDCHKKYDYRKWLDEAKKIEDATQFKVGGHSFGHMHVDWEKTDKGWRIAKVWICR